MRSIVFALLLGATLSGCSGTETGNPGVQVKLAMLARTTDEASVNLANTGSELEVERGLIAFDGIQLLSCTGDAGPELRGEVVVDITEPGGMEFTLDGTASSTCGVELRIAPPSVDPGDIGEYSVLLSGTRSDGTPFEIRSRVESRITLTSATGEAFDPASLILAFDLAVWLDPEEVHGAVIHENVAQIDDLANPELLAAIEARLEVGAELFVDSNYDGQLDADESDPVASSR